MRQFQEYLYAIDSIRRQDLLTDLAVGTAAARADEKGLKKMQRDISPTKTTNHEAIPDKYITK